MTQIDVYDSSSGVWATCDVLGYCEGAGKPLTPVEIVMVSQPAAVAANRVNFEDGTFGIFNVATSAVIDPLYGKVGKGCRLTPDGSGLATLTSSSNFPRGKKWASLSMWFRLITQPATSNTYMNLLEIGNTVPAAPKSQFTVFFNHGILTMDFNNTETLSIGSVTDNEWHRIEARVNFGGTQYTALVKLDGGAAQQFTSRNDKTPTTADALWVHYPTVPVDYTMDVDEVLLTTADTDPGWLS